jgi:hypothetical protein
MHRDHCTAYDEESATGERAAAVDVDAPAGQPHAENLTVEWPARIQEQPAARPTCVDDKSAKPDSEVVGGTGDDDDVTGVARGSHQPVKDGGGRRIDDELSVIDEDRRRSVKIGEQRLEPVVSRGKGVICMIGDC